MPKRRDVDRSEPDDPVAPFRDPVRRCMGGVTFTDYRRVDVRRFVPCRESDRA